MPAAASIIRTLPLACSTLLLLAGCESTPFYENHPDVESASLRVLTRMPGSTSFSTTSQLDCRKSPDARRLGTFSPFVVDGFFAERAGQNHKLALPGEEGLRDDMYADWKIDAGRPFLVHAQAVVPGGPGMLVGKTYVEGNTTLDVVGGFTPQAGHVYEIDYARPARQPELRLFELVRQDDGRTERRPVAFDQGSKVC